LVYKLHPASIYHEPGVTATWKLSKAISPPDNEAPFEEPAPADSNALDDIDRMMPDETAEQIPILPTTQDLDAIIVHNDAIHAEQHPSCLWNIVNADPVVRDPDNRILANLSKQELQSLEFITDTPLAIPDGEPPVHVFDMAEHVKLGDVVVAYGDVHYYYKHGSEREAFTFEVTTLEVVHRPDELPIPNSMPDHAGPSVGKRPASGPGPSSPKKKSFRSAA